LYVATNKYRDIFAICNCLNAAVLIPGKAVAVKMTILVNGVPGDNGAYWSGTAAGVVLPATINFDSAATAAAACASAAQPTGFGAPSFFLQDGTTPAVPLATTACTVPAANRATILTTPASAYTIGGTEGPYWWIDIPPIRIDPSILKNSELISVKVEIYDPTLPLPICPGCVVTICDCTIVVAQVCCTATTATTLTFPYFTQLSYTGDWWNGLVINNPTAAAGSCALTARMKNAGTRTATVAVPANGAVVDLLSNAATFTWAGTGSLDMALTLTAVCNYGGATGFAFMSNAKGDSMGYVRP
jgi:hypothetical protein